MGTAARIVSSSERATGPAVDGVGGVVEMGSGMLRGVGGVSGISWTSTSTSAASAGGASTSRALSRCSRPRRSVGLASACSVFLRVERRTIGSQPVGESRVGSLATPVVSTALAAGRRTPNVEGPASRDPIIGSRSTAEDATAAAGSRRAGRGVGSGSGVPSAASVASSCSTDRCSSWCASQRPNRSSDEASWRLGVGAMSSKVRRLGPPRDRFGEGRGGACSAVRLARCDLMSDG